MSDARPPAGTELCALDEIADPGARGFVFDPPADAGEEAWPFRGFVVRRGDDVLGYVDACPHVGASLAVEPDQYLTRRGDFLMCFNHGALFQIEDGLCVAGPCVKRALRPWAVKVSGSVIETA